MWYKAQIIWFIILTNNGFQNMWTFPRVLWGWQPVYLPPAEMSTGKFITARRKVQWEWTFLRVVYFVNMLSASEHPQKCPLPKFHCTVVHHRLYTCTFCSIRTGFKSVRDRQEGGETNVISKRRQITYMLSEAFYKWRLSLLSLTLLKPVLMLQKVQVYSLRCKVADHCVHILMMKTRKE